MAKNFRRNDPGQHSTWLTADRLPGPLLESLGVQEIFTQFARAAMQPHHRSVTVHENGTTRTFAVERRGCGIIERGDERFWCFDFSVNDEWRDYEVLVRAPLNWMTLTPSFNPERPLLVRIDSGCTTGQVFHDESCDCREQLHKAIGLLVENGEGVIVRIPRQDGRGMGLPFKLSTLTLQSFFGTRVFNTVKAAHAIADTSEIDQRTYGGAIAVMKFLEITPQQPLALATQNDRKTKVFVENGFAVEHVSIRVPETEKTRDNLDAKRRQLGHRT